MRKQDELLAVEMTVDEKDAVEYEESNIK